MADEDKSAAIRGSRRHFLIETGRAAAAACLLVTGLVVYARRSAALPPHALRPPGALPEPEFLGACIRCGMCVRDCPYKTLDLSRLGEDVTTGTPYFTARNVPCEMCDDIPCVKACPTGALDHALTDIDQARMGLAVLVDQENCLNFLGLRCDVCYRVCPVIDKAITLEPQHNLRTGTHTLFIPVVHSGHCTGCGKCEKGCPLEKAAIKVFPLALARGEAGHHYRLGWEEKKAAGKSLIDEQEIIDLPDRMPEDPTAPGQSPGIPPALKGDRL